MTTIAQRMRAATQLIGPNYPEKAAFVKQLRADADALEAVERELIEHARDPFGATALTLSRWADRIRGEIK